MNCTQGIAPDPNPTCISQLILVGHVLQGLNVYSILLHDTLVMSRNAVNKIVERMHTPINR